MAEVLGNIFNPYLQPQVADFGGDTKLPVGINHKYQTMKGNPWDAFNSDLQYPPQTRFPSTMTKAGESFNEEPEQLPAELVNIKRPQYSSVSGALIENQRVGVQLGMADEYRDNPYSNWTRGIQYYTLYVGDNPKQKITPVIYPQAWRPSEWAQSSVDFPQINRERTRDVTDLTLDNRYSCGSCEIASASLGTPSLYESRNSTAPLPVSMYPYEFPYTGQYTAREIGSNLRDYPQPMNPIVQLQMRNAGIKTPPIPADYDNAMLRQLRHGFTPF